jgi:DeoR/GlpR family transcriptional regulator of sugar metabolism
MHKRDSGILELISEHRRIEVAQLADIMKVSRVTIRKDLDALEEQGLIKRERGCAMLGSSDDMNNRLAFNYNTKRLIAKCAADQVKEGETVMIESGSCCALLADELAGNRPNSAIITNSAFIAGYIRKYAGVKILLLGGEYQRESQVMVGAIAKAGAENFFVEKLFIGADGFTEDFEFTGNDYSRAETVRDMAARARTVVVLTESSKFRRQGLVRLLPTDKVGMVITDDAVPAGSVQALKSRGIDVLTVPGN